MYERPSTSLASARDIDRDPVSAVDLEVMLCQLRADRPELRMQAARAFCDIEEPRAVEALVELLNDGCPLARVSAAYALGRNTAPEVVEPLIATLEGDWNGYVRKGVVWALGNAKDRRALPALNQALRHDISAVRLWAASALGQIGGSEAVAPLTEGVQRDPVAAVRSNCAWALGQLLPTWDRANAADIASCDSRYSAAIAALIAVITDDPDDGVQDDARAALIKVKDPEGLAAIAAWEDERY
ncbi:MAG: HEAT repeat domain-containing protein [Cyanobacteria bacterium J06642_2]